MGRQQGLTDQQLRDLPDYESSSAFSDVERAVLRYADAMSDTPVDVADEVFAGVRQHLEEVQIVELTSAIAWEHYRARFDHALGIESEGFSEGAFCALSAAAADADGSGDAS